MQVKDLKKDQIFYEKVNGQFYQFRALEDAHQKNEGPMWYCNARGVDGEVQFAQNDECPHYGPRLYDTNW